MGGLYSRGSEQSIRVVYTQMICLSTNGVIKTLSFLPFLAFKPMNNLEPGTVASCNKLQLQFLQGISTKI